MEAVTNPFGQLFQDLGRAEVDVCGQKSSVWAFRNPFGNAFVKFSEFAVPGTGNHGKPVRRSALLCVADGRWIVAEDGPAGTIEYDPEVGARLADEMGLVKAVQAARRDNLILA